jgi:hypothetical protein
MFLKKRNQHVEGVEKLQQLKERRRWEDQEADEKD